MLGDQLADKRREVVLVPVDSSTQGEILGLLAQKDEISNALKDQSKTQSALINLRQDQQTITTRLCRLTGAAKVQGVIAHLKRLLDADAAARQHQHQQHQQHQQQQQAMSGSGDHYSGISGASSRKRKRAAREQWCCSLCTLKNKYGSKVCRACETAHDSDASDTEDGADNDVHADTGTHTSHPLRHYWLTVVLQVIRPDVTQCVESVRSLCQKISLSPRNSVTH